jgi:mannose-1-phosphate guanylyltransferase
MKAILLAAGFGTRLRPLTVSTPKCLVSINGKPLLEIWLERLAEAGLGPLLINTHYLSSQVERFILSSSLKKQIKLVYEPVLLGTAGTLLTNIDFFEGKDGMLIHADNYSLADFKAFINAHEKRPAGCLMTMMTFKTDSPSECGIVELNKEGIVVGFHEKVEWPPSNLANGAVYIISPQMLNILMEDFLQVSDFSTEVLPHFIGKIFTYETKEVFMDIGTPEKYKMANNLL